MNPSMVSLIGAIALTGCAAMEHGKNGNWRGSGFPPTYPGDISEYHPAGATGNNSTREFDLSQRDDRGTSHDLATQKRKLILDKLDNSIQRSMSKDGSPLVLGYIVMFNEEGTESYMKRDGQIVLPVVLDKLCKGYTVPPSVYVPIPKEVLKKKKCLCEKVDHGGGFGDNESPHVHCTTMPAGWHEDNEDTAPLTHR